MPTSIILFSHGSVLCGAGESLRAMVHELEKLADCKVRIGYLNYSEPLFADAVDAAVADGATEIRVVPYFLVAGYFVRQQLPPLIEAAKKRHPQIDFHAAEAMRAHPLMRDIIMACAERTQTMDEWRMWWKVAPEFCRNDAACPLYETAFCAANDLILATNHASNGVAKENPPNPLYKGELSPVNSCLVETTALLVLVHGSPREESNIDMYKVVEEVRGTQKYFYVQVGFLECNEPSIPEAIQKCIHAGANRIVAVPYFLHAGRHVADDLPRFLEDASAQHPHVEFLMGDYLGREPLLAKVLLELAQHSKNTSTQI